MFIFVSFSFNEINARVARRKDFKTALKKLASSSVLHVMLRKVEIGYLDNGKQSQTNPRIFVSNKRQVADRVSCTHAHSYRVHSHTHLHARTQPKPVFLCKRFTKSFVFFFSNVERYEKDLLEFVMMLNFRHTNGNDWVFVENAVVLAECGSPWRRVKTSGHSTHSISW